MLNRSFLSRAYCLKLSNFSNSFCFLIMKTKFLKKECSLLYEWPCGDSVAPVPPYCSPYYSLSPDVAPFFYGSDFFYRYLTWNSIIISFISLKIYLIKLAIVVVFSYNLLTQPKFFSSFIKVPCNFFWLSSSFYSLESYLFKTFTNTGFRNISCKVIKI